MMKTKLIAIITLILVLSISLFSCWFNSGSGETPSGNSGSGNSNSYTDADMHIVISLGNKELPVDDIIKALSDSAKELAKEKLKEVL